MRNLRLKRSRSMPADNILFVTSVYCLLKLSEDAAGTVPAKTASEPQNWIVACKSVIKRKQLIFRLLVISLNRSWLKMTPASATRPRNHTV